MTVVSSSVSSRLRAWLGSGRFFRSPLFLLAVGALCLSLAPILVRLSEVGPAATAFWRAALATPILWAVYFIGARRSNVPKLRLGSSTYILVLGGLFFAVDTLLWHYSVGLTSVANATLLSNVAPVFVAIYGVCILKQRLSSAVTAALALALVGSTIMMTASASIDFKGSIGDALALSAALAFAAYIIVVAHARSATSTVLVMAVTTSVTALALVVPVVIEGRFLPQTQFGWAVLLGLAVVPHVIGQSLFAYALAHVAPVVGGLGLLLQPVFAAALSWLLFAEAMGPVQLMGAALVMCALPLANYRKN